MAKKFRINRAAEKPPEPPLVKKGERLWVRWGEEGPVRAEVVNAKKLDIRAKALKTGDVKRIIKVNEEWTILEGLELRYD